jgi:hypothetical protein
MKKLILVLCLFSLAVGVSSAKNLRVISIEAQELSEAPYEILQTLTLVGEINGKPYYMDTRFTEVSIIDGVLYADTDTTYVFHDGTFWVFSGYTSIYRVKSKAYNPPESGWIRTGGHGTLSFFHTNELSK